MCASVRACVRACASACACVRVCVCVCVYVREGRRDVRNKTFLKRERLAKMLCPDMTFALTCSLP